MLPTKTNRWPTSPHPVIRISVLPKKKGKISFCANRATSTHQPAYRVHASEHVAEELGRRAERTKDRDARDGLAVDGIQRRPRDRVCRQSFGQLPNRNPAPHILNKPTHPICACPATSGRTPVPSHKNTISARRPSIGVNEPTFAAESKLSMSTVVEKRGAWTPRGRTSVIQRPEQHRGDEERQAADDADSHERRERRQPKHNTAAKVVRQAAVDTCHRKKTTRLSKTRRHAPPRASIPAHLQSPFRTCSADARARRCRGNGCSRTARSPKALSRMPSAEQRHTVRQTINTFVQHGRSMYRSAIWPFDQYGEATRARNDRSQRMNQRRVVMTRPAVTR